MSGQTAVTQTPQQKSCQSNANTACDIWGRHRQMVNKALIRPVMLHDKSSEYDTGGFCFLKGSYHEESNLIWSLEIKGFSILWKHAPIFRNQNFLPSGKKSLVKSRCKNQKKKKILQTYTFQIHWNPSYALITSHIYVNIVYPAFRNLKEAERYYLKTTEIIIKCKKKPANELKVS